MKNNKILTQIPVTSDGVQPDIIGYFPIPETKYKPEQAPSELLPEPPKGKYAEVFAKEIVVVQMERNNLAEKIMKVLDETGIHYHAVATKETIRFFFKGKLDTPYYTGKIMCGAEVQMVAGKTGYLENLGNMKILHTDEEYDLIPLWMHPASTDDISPLSSSVSLLGESKWIEYMKPVYQGLRGSDIEQNKKAYKTMLDCAMVLNKNFRQSPFDERRMTGFLDRKELEFNMSDFFDTDSEGKPKFRKDAFCEFFIQRYRLINLDFLPYRYSNGIYLFTTADEIESLLVKYLKDSSVTMRKDIRNTIFSLLGVYAQRTSSKSDIYFDVKHPAKPELIAFENGIFDVSSGNMSDFNDNIIVTNRIPFDLKFDYYNELTAKGEQTEEMEIINNWLDSFSESNHDKRLVLEEVAGLTMYRRNAGLRRQHTILYGNKESGKSTYIRMLETLLGDSANCSHVSLEEICNSNNRFSLISMVGTALNTFADISHKTILDAARLKNLCTGDSINVEQKNQPVMSMSYQGKLVFGCNDLPRIEDRAISSRFEIIPCNADYNSMGTANIPNIYEDYLSKKECMEYFAYLAVTALQRFIGNGFKHTYCAENEEIRLNYERISDPVQAFVNSMPEEKIVNQDTSEVFDNYITYLVQCLKLPDREVENVTKNSLTTALKRLGYDTKRKSVHGNKIRVYIKCA